MKPLVLLTLGSAIALASTAYAANPPGTGQPSQSCENYGLQVPTNRPGNAFFASGAFNDTPTGVAAGVYANPTSQGGLSSGNSHVVAQYDVACFQQCSKTGPSGVTPLYFGAL